MKERETEKNSTVIEGRNAVLEAFRSGKTIDKLFVQDGCKDGPVQTILREARNTTPSSSLSPGSAWDSSQRQGITRE